MIRQRARKSRVSRHEPQQARHGHSLLELLAIMVIIGILAVVIIPRIGHHTATAKSKVCNQYVADLNAALERYYFDTETWASDLSDIQTDAYYPNPIPLCPVTGQPYAINATSHRVDGHNH